MNKSLTALLAVALGCASWQTAAFAGEKNELVWPLAGQVMWTAQLPTGEMKTIIMTNRDGALDYLYPPSHRVSNFSIHDIDTLRTSVIKYKGDGIGDIL